MDIATVVGLVLGHVLIFGSIMMGAGIGAFVDIPSVIIVVGGTIAAVMVSFPMNKFTTTGKVIKKSLMFVLPDPTEKIEEMAQFAALARKEGLLALEEKLGALDDAFLVKGLRLVVDGFPPEVVRDILESDLAATQERHGVGKAIMDKMGEVAPAFGMIGTLIGLVTMLKNLSDPSQIGTGMAVALLTTFYGAFLANVIFLPVATKLEQRKKEEALLKEVMIEGIVSIQNGDKPAMVKEKLKAYLPPALRDAMDAAAKK
ncbi:MAG TPA: motility protein A [Planctomycetes bacterium]|nr:motility protein A [Planctomycetota bacterium]